MHSTANSTVSKSSWEDLSQIPDPNTTQWENIKTQLDLILLALESLTGIGSEAMLSAAVSLDLESKVPDWVALWRLRLSFPLRKGQGERKKLDVEEARSLVLIICYLAKQHQELIRRAVSSLEQATANRHKPHQISLLGDYIDTFCKTYQERMAEEEPTSTNLLTHLALKLLINILFYSAAGGHRRLWLALIDLSTR